MVKKFLYVIKTAPLKLFELSTREQILLTGATLASAVVLGFVSLFKFGV